MPASETTITVESALAELRELFPDVEIQFTARVNAQGWRVWLGLRGGNFYGTTLSEAMAQVRTWKESQQ